jgi:hypothetical protein
MTKFRSKSFIPKNNMNIRPNSLVNNISTYIENYIDNQIHEKDKIILNLLYKEMKNHISNFSFWESIAAYNFCCYIYTGLDDKGINKICGRRVDKKNEQDNINKYYCSEHDRNHRKYYSKPIHVKDIENNCKHINKTGTNCKYSSRIDGLCVKHYKYIYNIDIIQIYKKIENISEFNKNYGNIEKEMELLYNIEITEFNTKTKKKNTEIRINKKDLKNKISVIQDHGNSNKNSNKKNSECLRYNKNNLENPKIGYKNENINVEYRKCEVKNCTNCKQYNIIYSTYCTDHISNRIKSSTLNYFYMNNNLQHSTQQLQQYKLYTQNNSTKKEEDTREACLPKRGSESEFEGIGGVAAQLG